MGQRDRRGVDTLGPADLTRMLDVHLVSAYNLSQAVATALSSRRAPGRIINVSSVIGQLGRAGDAAYAVAKAGLDGMTRALAADLGPMRSPRTRWPRHAGTFVTGQTLAVDGGMTVTF